MLTDEKTRIAFTGSETGEVVIGINDQDEIIYIIQFNPINRQEIDKHYNQGTLKEFIFTSNT